MGHASPGGPIYFEQVFATACATLVLVRSNENVALVRGVDEQGVSPQETSFYPLLAQVENCPSLDAWTHMTHTHVVCDAYSQFLFAGLRRSN